MNIVRFHLPTSIIAGPGVFRSLPDMLAADLSGGSTGPIAVVTDKGIMQTDCARELLELLRKAGHGVAVYDLVNPNPDEALVDDVTRFLRESGAEAVIGLGGGSSLDAAKIGAAMATNDLPLEEYQWNGAVFEKPPMPLYLLPTTAGTGSEVTGVSVISSRGTKKGVLGAAMYPKAALIDAELMATLPPKLTAITGMDALAHAVEAFVGRGATVLTDSFARQAIVTAGKQLTRVFADGKDIAARQDMALASTMAGIAFDQSGLGIVHAMASPVCADLHVAHGLAMAFLLPWGMETNRTVAEDRIAEIGRLLGAAEDGDSPAAAAEKAVEFVRQLRGGLDLEEDFRAIVAAFDKHKAETGIDEADFGDRAAGQFLMKNNPVHPDAGECTRIFTKIFSTHRV